MNRELTANSATNWKVIWQLVQWILTDSDFLDMVFDDDVKLMGLYGRYEDEMDEMKKQICNYINSETFNN